MAEEAPTFAHVATGLAVAVVALRGALLALRGTLGAGLEALSKPSELGSNSAYIRRN